MKVEYAGICEILEDETLGKSRSGLKSFAKTAKEDGDGRKHETPTEDV